MLPDIGGGIALFQRPQHGGHVGFADALCHVGKEAVQVSFLPREISEAVNDWERGRKRNAAQMQELFLQTAFGYENAAV